MLISLLEEYGTSYMDTALYSEMLFIYGGCSSWQSFVGAALISEAARTVSGLHLLSLFDVMGNFTTVSCNGGSECESVVDSLMDGGQTSNPECGLRNWTVTGTGLGR